MRLVNRFLNTEVGLAKPKKDNFWSQLLQELNLRSLILWLQEIYKSSVESPITFWETHKSQIKKGFKGELFTSFWEKADIVLFIPFHESINNGFLGCLYSLSQLKAVEHSKKVKVLVISHNSGEEENNFLKTIISEIGGSVELIVYNTELTGPTYSTQLAVKLLERYNNIEFFGIVDADTLVSPDWLNLMLATINQDPNCAVTVGPRTYLNKKYQEILYGKIKVSLERLFSFFGGKAKLVYGNSFFRFSNLRAIVDECLGQILNEGLVQEKMEKSGNFILLAKSAVAVSEGEKFDEFFWETIFRILRNFKMFIEKPSVSDHILFLLEDQYKRFPSFREMVNEKFSQIKETIQNVKKGSFSKEELLRLYMSLQRLYDEFNSKSALNLRRDIEYLSEEWNKKFN